MRHNRYSKSKVSTTHHHLLNKKDVSWFNWLFECAKNFDLFFDSYHSSRDSDLKILKRK